jgi:Na+-driven multidrug efflux pump
MRMKSMKAEEYVNRLRRGRRYTIIVSLVFMAFHACFLIAFAALARDPFETVFNAPGKEPAIAVVLSMMIMMCFFFAIGLGAALGKLIHRLSRFTEEELLVEMWDRISRLEQAR